MKKILASLVTLFSLLGLSQASAGFPQHKNTLQQLSSPVICQEEKQKKDEEVIVEEEEEEPDCE